MKASMIATALMLAATTAVTSAQAPTAGDPHHPPQSATPAPAPAQPPTSQPGMGMMAMMPGQEPGQMMQPRQMQPDAK